MGQVYWMGSLEEWRKCNLLLVHRSGIGGSNYLGESIMPGTWFLAQMLMLLMLQSMGIKTRGKDCVKCPHPMYVTKQELVWGAVFKGQDSRVQLKAVSSGAEVAIDGPGALPLLLCCRSVVAKAIKQTFSKLSFIHFRTFRTNDAVHKTVAFTGEGISEVEGLMHSTGMDDIVGKQFRAGETKGVITWLYSSSSCTYLQWNISCRGRGSSKCLSRDQVVGDCLFYVKVVVGRVGGRGYVCSFCCLDCNSSITDEYEEDEYHLRFIRICTLPQYLLGIQLISGLLCNPFSSSDNCPACGS